MPVFHKILLHGLDLLFRFRHVPKRVILANLTGFALVLLMLVGLLAVTQIGGVLRSLRTLTVDIGTSLTATREMRTALFDFRRELLYAVIERHPVDVTRVDTFRMSVAQLVRLYQSGSFISEDRALADQLQAAQSVLDARLADIAPAPGDPAVLLAADAAAEPLSNILRNSGRLNAQRLENLSVSLEQKLRFAITVTTILWGALLGLGILGAGLLLLYGWLDRVERSERR